MCLNRKDRKILSAENRCGYQFFWFLENKIRNYLTLIKFRCIIISELILNKKNMKYIISKDNEIVIFSKSFDHNIIAMKTIGIKNVVGAGFVDLVNNKCYGRSITLRIDSRKEDTEILNSQIS